MLLELFAVIKKIGYDFIVIYAPPVLASGDANWMSPFVDGVILSVSWGKTTEEQLLDAASQLRMNRAPLIGTVIDEVNPVFMQIEAMGVLCFQPSSFQWLICLK